MLRVIPLISILFNFYFLKLFETVFSQFFPPGSLPFTSLIRTLILYLIFLFLLYTPAGQRGVAFIVKGRNLIGREEKVLEPILEQLKDRTDIRGYSAPIWIQYKLLSSLNNVTGKKIKALDRSVNRISYEYMTGTVKVFAFDSLDIESNSYGNSIFISKGAIDSLETSELTALLYNEFAQIKYNIANKRLLHDSTILLGRMATILAVILAPIAYFYSLSVGTFILGTGIQGIFSSLGMVVLTLVVGMLRLIGWGFTRKYTNAPYMLYERKIFIEADRSTHKAGFSADMLSYLDKLYVFKLQDKDLSKLFVELRPLVAYRINYFENVLGYNRNLSQDNYAWSSNYMERVQTLRNQKS
ncbi:hypothetical protein [Senegalia massiliensis]|uniref:hypothetical protein n=1 Tax=Senegalia massiliensis TaxID=1720316 RepID=UPI00102FE14B|nr:hypothetical protein [Senegalia massiliensis]